MPAVMPAEVHTLPSWMKMGSGSSRTLGKRSANSRQRLQCVAARLPSSKPAVASRKAPLQTDATRRADLARALIQPIEGAIAAGGMNAAAAGDDQRVQSNARLQAAVRSSKPRPADDNGQSPSATTTGSYGRGTAGRARQIVGGGEHLQRSGDVEQLDVREGQDLDPAAALA